LPEGLEAHEVGATARPSRIPAHLSDTTWFTDKGLDYLRSVQHKPWFLHLGYYRPHPPFAAPAPYHDMYDPAQCPPPVRATSPQVEAEQHPLLKFYLDNIARKSFFQNGQGLASQMSESEVLQLRATYYGLMSEVDDQIGRVFKFLKESGQWDNTLVVLTSDHGEQLGDHHLLGKIGYFDESFHIPMIVRDPGVQSDATRGQIVQQFTETIDTMPTLLDWLGQPIPRTCDGASLLPFLHTGQAPKGWRTEVHYEFDFRNIFYSQPEDVLGTAMDESALAVVQDEDYKYVHFAAQKPLFFDLRKDPSQLHNLAEDPAYAQQVLTYAQKMLNWRLKHADKTLTGYAASPEGLIQRE